MKKAIFILLIAIYGHVSADEITEISLKKSKEFVRENPLITKTVDEMGLVDMWQRVEGIKNLIEAWYSDRSVFERPGKDELRSRMIYKRIRSHRRYRNFATDDTLVRSLKGLIGLHANIATDRMSGRVGSSVYLDVAITVISSGRYLAERIEAKYGKGRKVLKTQKPLNW